MVIHFKVLIFFIFTSTCWAEGLSTRKAPASTKKGMNEVFHSFVELIPYMNSEEKFINKKNESKIHNHLLNLSKAFSSVRHNKKIESVGFAPSAELIQSHIDETLDIFNLKHKIFALKRLQAVGNLCASCHTQLPELHGGVFSKYLTNITPESFSSNFEYAEFLFLIRKYSKSVRYYRDSIAKRFAVNKDLKGEKIGRISDFTEKNLKISLRRIMTVFTKVNYNPKRARVLIESYKDNAQISKVTQSEIKEWIKELKKWEKVKIEMNSKKDVNQFIQKYLEPLDKLGEAINLSHDVVYLIASGRLSRFLNSHPKSSVAPKIIFWLSKAERKLNNHYFYTLSELYLEECIKRYPSSPYAKKCFEQYKDDLTLGFTGTSGTFIPPEEKAKLKKLKKLLK